MSQITPLRGPASLEGRMRGSNQSGLRAHNERTVLSLIRRHGRMTKAEIARHTGLSPQTASVIMRVLESEELVLRDAPRRGRVGQPSTPMRLNPDGAFSLGLRIGRRSAELILMDFVGQVRGRERLDCPVPRVGDVLDFVAAAEPRLTRRLGPSHAARIAGLGVAMPHEFSSGGAEVGATAGEMDEWRGSDIVADLKAQTGHAVHYATDSTAACAAENVFGSTHRPDYLYFYVGAFVGGGLVIEGDLASARSGSTSALGAMPIPRAANAGGPGGFDTLVNFASVHLLEKMIEAEGGNPRVLGNERGDEGWETLGPILDKWVRSAAYGLSHAIVAAGCVYDFGCAVIDGCFPVMVRSRLVDETRAALDDFRRQGLSTRQVDAGTIGRGAREIGSASLPFFARYFLDHRVLYTEPAVRHR